ncbi:IS1404 transposase [Xanthomonas oryzae pv. oryzae KACC 10331]|uniref:IS1404 transposase n=1 Tax=Xanthomonas oryzae pv. oryzae (strain KACC10331 / KXO85) TaxID=291331 RepID=Q5GUJ9_XANOR|nr:IS1404 transposase [Xanthomonas oryzae pv. oryzae KACC 10331]
MSVPDAKRFKDLEAENTRLKKLLAEQVFQNDPIKDALQKQMVSAPARRTLVREWIEGGASERCALAAIGMSASALRYRQREDRNVELRERILALAQYTPSPRSLGAGDDLSQAAAGRSSREL